MRGDHVGHMLSDAQSAGAHAGNLEAMRGAAPVAGSASGRHDAAATCAVTTRGPTAAVRRNAAGHEASDTPAGVAGGGAVDGEGRAIVPTVTTTLLPAPSLADAMLLYYAALLDDAERARIAAENRLRTMTAPVDEHGHGLSAMLPEVIAAQGTLDALSDFEAGLVRSLERAMAAHPLGRWVKGAKGIGLKTAARLLAIIGDPAWHALEGRPRTVSELWAYLGLAVHDGQAQRLTKGQRANWSTEGKKRIYIIADGAIKHRCRACREAVTVKPPSADGTWSEPPADCTCAETHPYRHVYDAARAQYADAVGPDGEPLTALHQHRRAVRRVMKAVLKDMWRAARLAHGWPVETAEDLAA